MGMTDMQFKTYLRTQLNVWQETLELAEKSGDTEVQKKAKRQIADIEQALNS